MAKMNIFNTVPMKKPDSNRFPLDHDVKLSFGMGKVVPTCIMEVLPGDKFNIGVQNMLRFAPLVSPVMHRIKVDTHYFFVPNRILWPGWEDFIRGEAEVEPPTVLTSNIQPTALGDYLGYPTGALSFTDLKMSALPLAAYVKIWDEYFRDQNLQTERFVPLTAGDNSSAYLDFLEGDPFNRAWMHDYFTASLPFAQKGDAVTLPLTNSQSVPVTVVGEYPTVPGSWRDATTGNTAADGAAGQVSGESVIDSDPSFYDPQGTLEVDVNEEAVTINTLRRAFRLQEFLEKAARGGTRYVEILKSYFGVKSSDARIQRPEFIGKWSQNMVISEVLATAQTEVDSSTTPLGTMAGHGISVGGGATRSYYAEEWGFIIGVISVMPETAYQQGLHRSYSRFDRLDYAWPEFANIGEQEVKIKEVYANASPGTGPTQLEGTFGYVPRYAEYKYMNSRVAGQFKTSLAFWHLGRIFGSVPQLNEDFIQCDPSLRIFAVEDGQHIYAHIFNNISAVRKLPMYGVPTI